MGNANVQVHLCAGATDMRKSIDGLATLVTSAFNLDPFSHQWFVFCNKRRDKIKILYWETNGFWLYYKRLERGRFLWPEGDDKTLSITRRQLEWLIDGLSIVQPTAHREVQARFIC
jgi:transposase